jgi:biopolymer transport protein ExbB/TolQ
MSTGLLVVIIVVVVLVIAALILFSMRGRMAARRHERALEQRRETAAGEHREAAQLREQRAEQAERQSRIATAEAERARAEATLHEEKAGAHERGLADDELVDENGSLRDREDIARQTGDPDRGRDTVEVDRQEAERRGLVGGNGDVASADAPRQRSA